MILDNPPKKSRQHSPPPLNLIPSVKTNMIAVFGQAGRLAPSIPRHLLTFKPSLKESEIIDTPDTANSDISKSKNKPNLFAYSNQASTSSNFSSQAFTSNLTTMESQFVEMTPQPTQSSSSFESGGGINDSPTRSLTPLIPIELNTTQADTDTNTLIEKIRAVVKEENEKLLVDIKDLFQKHSKDTFDEFFFKLYIEFLFFR